MSSLDPVAVFRTEAAECLEAIEAGLLDLTHKLDDKDVVDAVFRGLHTLKGSGSMFGFDALAAFTHHCETAFDRVRKGEVPATAELVAAVLAAQDHMRALVDRPDADHGDTGQQLLAQLQAVNITDGRMVVRQLATGQDLVFSRIQVTASSDAADSRRIMLTGTGPHGPVPVFVCAGKACCMLQVNCAGVVIVPVL